MALVVNLAFTAFLPLLWIIGDSHLLRFRIMMMTRRRRMIRMSWPEAEVGYALSCVRPMKLKKIVRFLSEIRAPVGSRLKLICS